MELAECDLKQYLMDYGAIECPKIFRAIAFQIVDGINYLHGIGFIHRDLSSRNILIKGQNFMLTDFGLSVQLERNVKDM